MTANTTPVTILHAFHILFPVINPDNAGAQVAITIPSMTNP